MAYTAPQIGTILLKADRTMYKIGQIAYENMFAEDNEALDYERDIIFIYKKAVEYADDLFLGTEKLDKVVERLAAKISAYDYGELNPIYANVSSILTSNIVAGSALNDLSDVTITNVQDNQILSYDAVSGQWINIGVGSAVRNSQAFIATAGQTVFTTAYPFNSQLLDLYINGVKINSLSYTTFGEYQITLNDGCLDGDIVDVVIYDTTSSVLPSVNSLNDLIDVSIGALANNQVLYYNSTTGLWQNGAVGGGTWGSITGTLSNQTDLQNALNLKVPYTGATANVNLGEFGLTAGQITLDTSPTGVAVVGTTRWNDATGTSETTLKGGNVTLRNGVDLVARVVNKVTPNTTLTKASYQAVRVTGAQGQRLAVAYAQANNDANSADTIGLVCETIPTNQEGFIMAVGQLENINTTGSLQGEVWVDGDVLYLSPFTPGAITKVKPIGNGHIIVIGYVEYAHQNNGKIYVKVMNGWELDELHDVSITTPLNNDALIYETSTGLWKNKSISTAIGYTPVGGSGVSGQIAYWNGTSTQTGSNNLFWDATNSRLGIGTNAPSYTAEILKNYNGSTSIGVTNTTSATSSLAEIFCISSNGYIALAKNSALRTTYKTILANDGYIYNATSGNISILNDFATGNIILTAGASSTAHMTLHNTGNLLLGSTSNSGERLQVTGNVLINGASGNVFFVKSSGGANLFYIQNVGAIGFTAYNWVPESSTASVLLDAALSRSWNVTGNKTNTSGVGSAFFVTSGFAPTSGTGVYNAQTINPTINQTGGANGITRGLYVNPTLTAADWRSIEWSNNTGWGLYGTGTANNYLAGSLGVKNTSPLYDIDLGSVTKTTNSIVNVASDNPRRAGFSVDNGSEVRFFSGYVGSTTYNEANSEALIGSPAGYRVAFGVGSTVRARLYNTGNFVIQNGGTYTDGGQRLQVQGDVFIKGSGNDSATTSLTIQNSSSLNILRVRNDGALIFGNANNAPLLYTGGGPTINSQALTFGLNNYNTWGNNESAFTILTNTNTTTAGTSTANSLTGNFAPGSGSHNHNFLRITATINQTGGANGITRGLYIQSFLNSAADFRAIETSAGNVLFGTGFFWNNTQNRLGIGIQTPSTALDILGTDNVLAKIKSSTNTGSASYVTYNNVDSSFEFGMYGSTRTAFGMIGSNSAYMYGIVDLNIASLTNIKFGTDSGGSPTERMRIFTNGNVGINTGATDGGQRFQVQGTTLLNGNVTFSSATGMFWDATNSRLGIGTNAPASSLDIRGKARIETSATTELDLIAGGGNILRIACAATTPFIGTLTNAPLGFFTSATERARVSTNGNLLVGITTDTGERLQVQGTTLLNGNVTFSSSTGMFWDATNSRLGIGTNAPAYSLDIRGNINGAVVSVLSNSNTGAAAETALVIGQSAVSSPFNSIFFSHYGSGYTTSAFRFPSSAALIAGVGVTNGFSFVANNDTGHIKYWTGTTASEKMRLFNGGNLLIQNGGTFTDSGERLQVTGDVKIVNGTLTSTHLKIGTSSTVGSFSTPAIAFNTTTGIYSDTNRIFFVSAGSYAGGFSSVGFIGNHVWVSAAANSNDLNTPKLGGYRLNAAGLSSGLAGNSAGDISIATNNLARITATYTGEVGIGITPTALLDLNASTTARASLRIRSGVAPTSPNDGDIWYDGTNLYMKVGATTKTFTLV